MSDVTNVPTDEPGTDTSADAVRRTRAIEALRDAQAVYQDGQPDREQYHHQVAFVCVGDSVIAELVKELAREHAQEMVKCRNYKAAAAHYQAMVYYTPDTAKYVMAEVFAEAAYNGDAVCRASELYKWACRCVGSKNHNVVTASFDVAECVLTLHCSQRHPDCAKFPRHAVLVPASHLPKAEVKKTETVTV